MYRALGFLFLCLSVIAVAQEQKPAPTLKSILLDELRSVHNNEDWFVPAKIAVEGLTAEQAGWSPGKGNHSVGQLAYHLWFWDARALADRGHRSPGKISRNRRAPDWRKAGDAGKSGGVVRSAFECDRDRGGS